MTQARYYTAFQKSQDELEASLYALLDDLNAAYEEARANPLNGYYELEALVAQNFEYSLNIQWKNEANISTLITFDVELDTPVEPYRLDEALAVPAQVYFSPLILVYNSYGRERSLRLFPLLLDLENILRELIISVMLTHFGSSWWEDVIVTNNLNRSSNSTAEQNRAQEIDSKLHDYLAMHYLYYLELKALREIMEKIDELKEADVKTRMTDPTHLSRANRHKWEQNLIAQLPFASILENYDRVFIKDKISEIRELRNRLVHGRYLTESNEQIISIICQQIHRFLVSPGYVGNFNDRTLINLQGL